MSRPFSEIGQPSVEYAQVPVSAALFSSETPSASQCPHVSDVRVKGQLSSSLFSVLNFMFVPDRVSLFFLSLFHLVYIGYVGVSPPENN